MAPYDEGYAACLRGEGARDNPYAETTSEHAEWARGWRDADDDET